MVKINGEELNVAGKTIAEYLATTNFDPKRIAVERNGARGSPWGSAPWSSLPSP